MTTDISQASFETLEAMLLEREAHLKREHFDQTKQQIMDSAVKFLPKNSRTLALFSKSGSGEADIFIDSMRHSLRTKISELDQQIAAVKAAFPNLARESIRAAVVVPRFEPSNLCLLAFRTVSKKDVVRGMSPELFGAEVFKLFSLLGYFLLEKRSLSELLRKPKMDLLNEVSDFYLAHLAAQTVEPIHRCNDLTLQEKMSLEEFLDSNPGVFRLVSDVNLNGFYLSVAFLVFECLAFMGLRRFVGFMEKKKDGAAVLKSAAAELTFLSQKRDLYSAKVGDLGQMEREMHSFNGWAK
jgi:hypothetical protein